MDSFPLTLPDGYEFPENAPEVGFAMLSGSADDLVYQWWGCSLMLTAWTAIDDGDTALADEALARVNEAKTTYPLRFRNWEPPMQVQWGDSTMRESGDSGLCYAWMEQLDQSAGERPEN